MTVQIQTGAPQAPNTLRGAAIGPITGLAARVTEADPQSISAWQQVLRLQAGQSQGEQAAEPTLEEEILLELSEASADQSKSLESLAPVLPLQRQQEQQSGHGGSPEPGAEETDAAAAPSTAATGHSSLMAGPGATPQGVDKAPDLPHVQVTTPELWSEKQQMTPVTAARAGDPSAVTIHFQKDSLSGTAMQLTRHAGSWQLSALCGNAAGVAQLQSQSAVLVQRFSQRLGKLEVDVVGNSERKRILRPDESSRDREVSVDVEDR